MKTENIVPVIVGIVGLVLFTWLLFQGTISAWQYTTLLGGTAVVALLIYVSPRVKEVIIWNMTLKLNEAKQVTQRLEAATAEAVERYGGIENLQREPMVLDAAKMEELGLGEGLPPNSAAMRYPVGCIKRERERLASIFVNEKTPEAIAKGVIPLVRRFPGFLE